MISIRKTLEGITFKIIVIPRSSKNEIAGEYNEAVKIRLKAPPVDGAANKMCIDYLSKCLNIKKSSLEIISGQTSKTKQILWKNDDNEEKTKISILHSLTN